MRKWKEQLKEHPIAHWPNLEHLHQLLPMEPRPMVSLEEMEFVPQARKFPERVTQQTLLNNYHNTRDVPSVRGTSRLSLHLRFGTISIRKCVHMGEKHNEKWLNELIWRDFYQMIIYHFPQSVDQAFKPAYEAIEWEENEAHFNAWCEGRTGYPLVDAGMRELHATGFMHNRVRMVTASFLTKHLLIDWKRGERYFAAKLLDFELASNVGGWQWASSSGCDAAPYFRVFNPHLQLQKFDPDLKYVKTWIPEWGTAEPETHSGSQDGPGARLGPLSKSTQKMKLFGFLSVFCVLTTQAMAQGVQVGSELPDIRLLDQEDRMVALKEMAADRPAVIYFYPKDDTPGCTAEACAFRDRYEEFMEAGAVLIGISSDGAASHRSFAQKHQLPFPLLSDPQRLAQKKFAVPKNLLGLLRTGHLCVRCKGICTGIFNSQLQATRHVEESLSILNKSVAH